MSERAYLIIPLTIYTYDNEYREALNLEEATKFRSGVEYARTQDELDEVILIVNGRRKIDDLESWIRRQRKIGRGEKEAFIEDVVGALDGMRVKINTTDLTDYFLTAKKVEKILSSLIERPGWKSMKIYGNFSTGHKIGTMAAYFTISELLTEKHRRYLGGKKGKKLLFRPFHAEGDRVTMLPVVDMRASVLGGRKFESYENKNSVEEELLWLLEFLDVLEDGKEYDQLRNEMKGRFDERVIGKLIKTGMVGSSGLFLEPTERGKNYRRVLRAVKSQLRT